MTVRDYISGEVAPFFTGQAMSLDMFLLSSEELDAEYSAANESEVNKKLIGIIERLIFRPRLKAINENGFSAEVSYADLGKYYQYLCSKYGVAPDSNVLAASGINVLQDVTDEW